MNKLNDECGSSLLEELRQSTRQARADLECKRRAAEEVQRQRVRDEVNAIIYDCRTESQKGAAKLELSRSLDSDVIEVLRKAEKLRVTVHEEKDEKGTLVSVTTVIDWEE